MLGQMESSNRGGRQLKTGDERPDAELGVDLETGCHRAMHAWIATGAILPFWGRAS